MLYLNKRENMKKISIILLGFFLLISLQAEEKINNIDKLDALDQQSKEFFKAITGLEKDYLEDQIQSIKNKKEESDTKGGRPAVQQVGNVLEQIVLSDEQFEKNVFTHQNEIARLTTDFTRTKKLKDLKIKSMYSFNGKDYVVLDFNDTENSSAKTLNGSELSGNIEGRYIEGDNILGHKIIDINTRTKSVELYKKLDEEHGYRIFLSNYGISVSNLEKIEKINTKDKTTENPRNTNDENSNTKDEYKTIVKEESSIKNAFDKVESNENRNCFAVNKNNLNVRVQTDENSRILRVLRINDIFSVQRTNGDWLNINTIYKKQSGDVMDVSDQNNWVQNTDGSLRQVSCK